jgi:hypothetical protein
MNRWQARRCRGEQSKWQSCVAGRKKRFVILVLETTSVILCCDKFLEIGKGRVVGPAIAE